MLAAMTTDTCVAVVGLGYVGLPLAISFVEAGLQVEGVDVSASRVAELNAGRSPIDDIADERLKGAIDRGFRAATNEDSRASEADAIFVCVPTPITTTKDPDLGPVLAAAAFVCGVLRPGQLIVLQSTTYPGTTTGPFRAALEASGLVAGRDFDLAFAPERVNPGDPASAGRTVPRLVGGSTPAATERAAALLRTINDRVVELSSPDAAEMAKLLENTFRNVNIAFVNQLALLCERMGLDVWEVIDAAATKPFGFMRFTPGPGVGGHCIPVDPVLPVVAGPRVRLHRPVHRARRRHQLRDAAPRRGPRRGGAERARAWRSRGEGRRPRRRLQAQRPRHAQLAGGRRASRGLAERGGEVRYHDPHVPSFRDDAGDVHEGVTARRAARRGPTSSSWSPPTRRSTGTALYAARRPGRRHDQLLARATLPRPAGPAPRRRLVACLGLTTRG